MFQKTIEDHLRDEENERKSRARFSENVVAKQHDKTPAILQGGGNMSEQPAAIPRKQEDIAGPVAHHPGHKESNVKIFFTRDYDKFEKISGNRVLNMPKINRIKRDIQNGLDVLKYYPITVHDRAGTLEIVDGQHRFQVAKSLGSMVWYIIMPDLMSLMEIAKVNSNTEKWKDDDFINCYAAQGNEHYIALRDFRAQYGFPLSSCMKMLRSGNASSETGSSSKNAFHEGRFQVKELEQATELAETVKKFKAFPGHKSGGFIVAISKILTNGIVPIDEIVGKFEKNADMLTAQSNWKEYLVNLELIYNKGNHTRKVIY